MTAALFLSGRKREYFRPVIPSQMYKTAQINHNSLITKTASDFLKRSSLFRTFGRLP